ncbi:hypothetical protein JTE90_024564 [Oedothorax gibbosus]|uniref:Uncharacterized protein n=1 Tax=Oedothorax gibbosus TaxID=931172 RepID=A0AAV6VE22_9ARAC|nr:hypothetical protein JTE90_024564 [Oedothorax gibbosus]
MDQFSNRSFITHYHLCKITLPDIKIKSEIEPHGLETIPKSPGAPEKFKAHTCIKNNNTDLRVLPDSLLNFRFCPGNPPSNLQKVITFASDVKEFDFHIFFTYFIDW